MRRGIFLTLVFSVAVAALAPFGLAWALDVPAAPSLTSPVVDQAGVLTQNQVSTLVQQINTSRTQKDYQFGILVIKSLDGNAIEDYSIKVARAWGVGDKTTSNGVLLLVVVNDHKLRIEVGRGLEGDLTDAESGRIIRNTITPQFKKGDYYSGISLGVQDIAAQVTGRPEQDSSARNQMALPIGSSFSSDVLFWIFIVAINIIPWFFAIMARTKSWWLGGIIGGTVGVVVATIAAWALWSIIMLVVVMMVGFLLDWAVSRNYARHVEHGILPNWWAGGSWMGGGGSGGGGGGSFGGGGFSGGGSSGSW